MIFYKYDEIQAVLTDWLEETKRHQGFDFEWYVNKLIADGELHHEVYNTDYFIIGTYKAQQWMGDNAFNIIGIVKDYEIDNFGEVYTDLSDPEKVVNMFSYIAGEQVISDFIHNEWEAEEEPEDEDEQPELVEGEHYLKAERKGKFVYKITTPRDLWPNNWRKLLLMVDGEFIMQYWGKQ